PPSAGPIVIHAPGVSWADGPPSLPRGAQFALLEGNPAEAVPLTLRLKFPPSYRVPPHWHAVLEHVTVLSATRNVGMGEQHAYAHEALRSHDPNALADFHPTDGGRVVTVCAAVKTSMLAAERLRARGLSAVSLEGGMRAWSLAWNTADVPCLGSTARIVQLRRTGKGCLSYLIGSNGAAAVVDASLEPRVYHRVADKHGWRIRTVLETHVHADH